MQKTKQIYCKEFQAMLDDLEDEDHNLEETTNQFAVCKKRRLNLNQVKGLEKSFEADNKLEPERKLKLSEELDLQPRQVAIWFQNRRARSKTKQLEKDYDSLKANFDALKANYSNLEQQKSALTAKLEELKSKIENGNADTSKGFKEESPVSEQSTKRHHLADHAKCKQVINSAYLDFNGNSSSSSSPDQFIPDSTMLLHDVCQPQMVKIEHNFIGAQDSYHYFPVDQVPNFHWYCLEQ